MLRNHKRSSKSKDAYGWEHERSGIGSSRRSSLEWFLVQKYASIAFKLNPHSVILIGREECDINILSPSVEKRHAVLCFDPSSDCFSVKDLNTTNGTFLNNRRISSDRPEQLQSMDLLRFGYDSNSYEVRLGKTKSPDVHQGVTNYQNDQRNLKKFSSPTPTPTSDDPGPEAVTRSSGRSSCSSSGGVIPERFSLVMQQRGNSLYGSRVSSPSLTLDSGRGSSSAPSSPAKEMSPVSNTFSSNNVPLSPTFSRKSKPPSGNCSGHGPESVNPLTSSYIRRGSSADRERDGGDYTHNNCAPITALPNDERRLRRDPLEDEINKRSIDPVTVFPHLQSVPRKNTSMNDFESDLRVPNEVFDEHLTPKEDIMEPTQQQKPPYQHTREGMSRPRSLSGSSSQSHSLNGIPPPPPLNAPSPLYGTPHWWPQKEEGHTPSSTHDTSEEHDETSFLQNIRDEAGISSREMEKLSLNSEESSQSFASESLESSDATGIEGKKYTPMAFTVDFDDSPKKFGISEPLSKFVPRHRRNISLTKADTEVDAAKERVSPMVGKDSQTVPPLAKPTGKGILGMKPVLEKELTPRSSISMSKNSRIAKLSLDNKAVVTDPVVETESSSSGNGNSFLRKISAISKEVPTKLTKRQAPSAPTSKPNSLFAKDKLKAEGEFVGKSDLPLKKSSVVVKSEIKSKTLFDTATVVTNSCDKLLQVEEDASSETGTYTIDKDNPEIEKARNELANLFGKEEDKKSDELGACGIDSIGESTELGSGAPEWVREWAEQAAQQHQKIVKELNPLPDTQLFLQETENVVSAMQERVTRNLSNHNSSHNSDTDDEATHQSPVKVVNKTKRQVSTRASPLHREASVLSDSGYQVGYQSDSSNEGMREYKNLGAKLNKAMNIRRGRLVGYDSDGCTTSMALNRHSLTLPVRGGSPRPPIGTHSNTPHGSSFSRNDGGRFSLRMPKSATPPLQTNPTTMLVQPRSSPAAVPRKPPTSNPRVIDQIPNRKSAPPTMPIPSGVVMRKPPSAGNRSNSTLTAKEVELANWKRRKSYDPMRAAAEGRKKRGSSSGVETTIEDMTPTSMSKHSEAIMSKSLSFHLENSMSSRNNSEEEDMIYVVDEMDSSHSNSPIHLISRNPHHDEGNYYGHGIPQPSMRPKNKLEALDNLVIATIHSLSNKVRTSSRQLLEKLQMQHADNENGALLEEMVSQLKELEVTSSPSSPNKSPSRELSGTLKNLKKLEQVILVLDRVLCDDSGSDANM